MTTGQKPDPTQADVYQQMNMMVTSHWVAQVVRAAVDLSLADHLAEGSLTADQVARREGSAPGTTFRLMRACVVLELLTADTEGRFHSTPLLQTLRKDAPGSLRGLALATTLPGQWLAWNEFSASVRAGRSQAVAALGTDFFDYLERHPSEARDFSGRIAVVEMIVGELSDPGPAALMDMNMLAAVPGQERSLTEYDALLTAAGLRCTAVLPTSSAQGVIEAVAA